MEGWLIVFWARAQLKIWARSLCYRLFPAFFSPFRTCASRSSDKLLSERRMYFASTASRVQLSRFPVAIERSSTSSSYMLGSFTRWAVRFRTFRHFSCTESTIIFRSTFLAQFASALVWSSLCIILYSLVACPQTRKLLYLKYERD